MLPEKQNPIVPSRDRAVAHRQEPVPVIRVPATTTGRDGTAAIFYIGILAILPTIGFGMRYGMVPLAPLLILPTATFAAWHLATRRYAAFEDTPPGHAAFVQSCLVWMGLVLTWPATLAFDVATTMVWQLIAGGFIAVMGPGVAKRWADLPRQIYVPVQRSPPPPEQRQPKVIAGAALSDFDEVYAEQQDYEAGRSSPPTGDGIFDDSYLDDEDEDLETF